MIMERKRRPIAVIGATGSVGSSILGVCAALADDFDVWALAANTNVDALIRLGKIFGSRFLVLADPLRARVMEQRAPEGICCLSGIKGIMEIIEHPECEEVVFASSGTDTLPALMRALELGRKVYLANKEIIVAAGDWIAPLAKGGIIPLDSEHNAIWQCLNCEKIDRVRNIFLTASGGPFLDTPVGDLKDVSFREAASHPVWPMGKKISVDSATLMNKGIEMIEARYLFSVEPDKIWAVIHPQALVHGFVEFVDGAVKMLFSRPDMRLAALSALGFPDRLENPFYSDSQSLFEMPDLKFQLPDEIKFPCLRIAKEASRMGGAYPALLIGADEGAVSLFMNGRIGFLDIPGRIDYVLASYRGGAPCSWEESLFLVERARVIASEI